MTTRFTPTAATATDPMLHPQITGGGGVQLHVAETGNRQGRPILFIHGIFAVVAHLASATVLGSGSRFSPGCDGLARARSFRQAARGLRRLRWVGRRR
jgi:pimeloyl-ACP methyl ester carboxylesterase